MRGNSHPYRDFLILLQVGAKRQVLEIHCELPDATAPESARASDVTTDETPNTLPHAVGYSPVTWVTPMNAADFRRIALSLEGAEEGSHMGAADFRVGGRIFATLASQNQGYGNLMLTPEQQAEFVGDQPDLFVPIAGGWGRMGMTHIRLAAANEDVLAGALRTAWRLRIEKNAQTVRKKRTSALRGGAVRDKGKKR